MGFLLGSCGVGLALTSEICLKGLPKTPTGEILQFKGLYEILLKVKHDGYIAGHLKTVCAQHCYAKGTVYSVLYCVVMKR